MEKPEMKKIFDKVKEHVRQEQEEGHLVGLFLEDLSRELEICEEDILSALADQVLDGELMGIDILFCFSD